MTDALKFRNVRPPNSYKMCNNYSVRKTTTVFMLNSVPNLSLIINVNSRFNFYTYQKF